MAKTFTMAPRPGSPEAMLAYERGGPGQSAPAYPRAHEHAAAQISIPADPQMHIRADQQTHIPTKAERVKRLSIDMPMSMHRRFKLACVAADKLMVEEVLAFIERRTVELEDGL
jgi:hypothetical protein